MWSRPSGAGSAGSPGRAVLGPFLGLLLLVGLLAGCTDDATPGAVPGDGTTRAASPGAPTPGGAAPVAQDTYGGYPSFLPPDTLNGGFDHRVVDASAKRPALATQGDTVRVHVGGTTVLATLSGPDVPVAGQQYQAPASPATWHVVLRGASAPLPLDPATFQAIDERGAVYRLKPEGHIPAVVRPGRVVRFDLFAPAFEVGEGRLRWIPVGHLAPVEWDFTVETD